MVDSGSRVINASNRVEVVAKYVPSYPVGKVYNGKDFLPWGEDNIEPSRLHYFRTHSPTLSSCLDTKALFIEGNGFSDEKFYRAKINKKGLKVDDLLRKLSKDIATYRGFAWHVNYKITNAGAKVSQITHIPVKKIRLSIPDDADYIAKVAIVNNVDNLTARGAKREKLQFFDVFNPNEDVIKGQIAAAGGFDQWKGQVFYWFDTDSYYPEPHWLAVEEDIKTEIAAKESKTSDAWEGFSGTMHITEFGTKNPDANTLERNQKKYSGFKGPKGGRIMVHYADTPDTATKFENFDARDLAKNYEYTERSSRDTIRQIFSIPGICYGMEIAGKLGTSQEFEDATKYVQRFVVNSDQRAIMDAFEQVFEHYEKIDEINPKGPDNKRNYKIENLSLNANTAADANGTDIAPENEGEAIEVTASQQAIRATVGWVDAVLQIKETVRLNPSEYESAVEIVKEMVGYTDEKARKILGSYGAVTN